MKASKTQQYLTCRFFGIPASRDVPSLTPPTGHAEPCGGGPCSEAWSLWRWCCQSARPRRLRSPPSRSRSLPRALPPRSLFPRSPRSSSTATPMVCCRACSWLVSPSRHRPSCSLAELLDKVETWSVDCVAQWLENLGFRAQPARTGRSLGSRAGRTLLAAHSRTRRTEACALVRVACTGSFLRAAGDLKTPFMGNKVDGAALAKEPSLSKLEP